MNYSKVENIYLKLLKINMLLDNKISKMAKQFNFNSTELMIYLDIKNHPNTDLNALCKRLGLKKSAASKAINKLIINNNISSEPNLKDQRKVALNYIEFENEKICKETMLENTFSGIKKSNCDLDRIQLSLDETIELLSD